MSFDAPIFLFGVLCGLPAGIGLLALLDVFFPLFPEAKPFAVDGDASAFEHR